MIGRWRWYTAVCDNPRLEKKIHFIPARSAVYEQHVAARPVGTRPCLNIVVAVVSNDAPAGLQPPAFTEEKLTKLLQLKWGVQYVWYMCTVACVRGDASAQVCLLQEPQHRTYCRASRYNRGRDICSSDSGQAKPEQSTAVPLSQALNFLGFQPVPRGPRGRCPETGSYRQVHIAPRPAASCHCDLWAVTWPLKSRKKVMGSDVPDQV